METPPFLQPGAGTVFWVLLGAFVAGELLVAVRSRLDHSGRRVHPGGQVVTVVAVDGSILAGLAFAVRGMGATPWPGVFFGAGLALMTIGLVIRQWAIVTLGRLFTDDIRVHAAQAVVDRGPYRWVRHPSYTGLILFLTGLGLGVTSWLSILLLIVAPTAVLIWRIHIEEHALVDSAGENYRRYAEHRRRLFPGIW